MPLLVASLNSGSNGNAYYIGNEHDAVLIDAGISCRSMELRMAALGLDPARLRAIFITHEHTDHISGLATIVRKYALPVYITPLTRQGAGDSLPELDAVAFTAFSSFSICSLQVTAFPKNHDAVDPHSVVVSSEGINVGVFTDIGNACANVEYYFRQCHAVFLETNYDEAMLANGRYPIFLRRRITGGKGHLSNAQALQLFLAHRPSFMTHLFLSHLSSENNHPSLVEELFNTHANGLAVVHAPRDRATQVFRISSDVFVQLKHRLQAPVAKKHIQLRLF